VLTDLDVLQCPLTRNDDIDLVHRAQARTGLDQVSPN
jgi:hypothetical protein